ncbi:dynein light chain Tctex-type 1 [Gambusia affinis]|uniref:dynein light chain Tctex-type 1 n=1 Tax=Gambusia affinis TaxID=33528 RepID=UPI001CDCEAA9|nr:dynein light chain Tctex-type 1 [Gambusia affinis]
MKFYLWAVFDATKGTCPSEQLRGLASLLNCFVSLQTTFIVEEVSKIIKDSVETVIGENSYKHGRVNQWTTSVVEQCLIQLSKLDKPFKFIVNCIIMQKNGAGLQTASTCCWDNTTDGSCTVRWENDTMYVIISVFGLAI